MSFVCDYLSQTLAALWLLNFYVVFISGIRWHSLPSVGVGCSEILWNNAQKLSKGRQCVAWRDFLSSCCMWSYILIINVPSSALNPTPTLTHSHTYTLKNEDYRLRYASSEWNKIEYELTRERGLWGPENPSQLDKWMLDTVEGMCHTIVYSS